MPVSPIPEGYHSLTPYLIIRGAADALAYYAKAFGATELFRMPGPEGKIMHAEMQIGNSRFMLADEFPQMNALSPAHFGGTPVSLMIYIEDVDTVFARAIEAGGMEVRPVVDQFYGDRSGTLVDPFGHQWTISTHVEDVPPEEMEKRAAEAMKRK